MCHTNCPKKVVKMIDSSPKCNFSLISVNLFTIVKFRLHAGWARPGPSDPLRSAPLRAALR